MTQEQNQISHQESNQIEPENSVIHYKVKSMRLAEETWENLKELNRAKGKTWNMFMVEVIYMLRKNKKG